jgi:hypothetical protein
LGESLHNREEEYDERRVVEPPPDLAETVRSLKYSKSHDPEEFKKSKPPTFDGEIKKGEEAKV